MHVNTGHHHLREQIPSASGGSAQTQRERPNSAGAPKSETIERIPWLSLVGAPKLGGSVEAPKLEPIKWISGPILAGVPKLGGSAQTRRERPNSAIVTE